MNPADGQRAEWRFEQMLGNLLRAGVLAAAVVVLLGGIIYLARHGGERPNYKNFSGTRADLGDPRTLWDNVIHGHGRAIVELGLLLLIATPVARVTFSVFGFARQRDKAYVLLTLIVLGVLIYSLFFGRAL